MTPTTYVALPGAVVSDKIIHEAVTVAGLPALEMLAK
jgi:hypothetical protein